LLWYAETCRARDDFSARTEEESEIDRIHRERREGARSKR
jgi:hypothetical protein